MKHSMMLILIAIVLVPGLAVGAGGNDVKPLAVELLPLHPVYKVNEPIRFRIKVNQDFYLYVWQVDEKKKVRRPLTLNLFNEVDLYEGGRVHTLPTEVDFTSNKPGVEKFIFMVSTYQIDEALDPFDFVRYGSSLLEQLSTKRIEISEPDGRVELVTPYVTQVEVRIARQVDRRNCDGCPSMAPVFETAQVHNQGDVEALRVTPATPEAPVAVPAATTPEVPVAAVPAPAAPATPEVLAERPEIEPLAPFFHLPLQNTYRVDGQPVYPFITTDRTLYGYEEQMNITFGANGHGYVYLFLLENGENPQFLKEYPVVADQAVHATAYTQAPGGPQAILAIFSPERVPANQLSRAIPAIASQPREDFVAKGLRMVDESSPYSFALYGFEIQ